MREAQAAGYTEPHPAEDLRAQDSARKLLILLREAGIEWEPERVQVQSLVPPELAAEEDAERFLQGLTAHDQDWALKAEDARKQGLRLGCLAEFDGHEARVGLVQLPAADPFARSGRRGEPGAGLDPALPAGAADIAGPGAGTEVTAAGVLTDIIKAVTWSQAGVMPCGGFSGSLSGQGCPITENTYEIFT